MSLINFPTYDQIVAVPIGSKVEVHLRERTGERCIVTGNVHTGESGTRKVGPFTLAGMRPRRGSYTMRLSSESIQFDPYVPETVVALNVISTPAAVA